MNYKKTLLATMITSALLVSGCSDDDNNDNVITEPDTPITELVTNTFVDAAVDGLYYQSVNGHVGFTANGGEYEAESGETITFYLGGESGLKIGAASNRDIISPFEAAGTYERALNLAILLQTLDETPDNTDLITLPAEFSSDNISEQLLVGLQAIQLDDRDTVTAFLTDVMDFAEDEITSEESAVAHMKAALDTERGSDEIVPMFVKGSGNIIREIIIEQYQLHDLYDGNASTDTKEIYVHADKTSTQEVFDATRSAARWDYRLDNDAVVLLAGNNDEGYSSGYAKLYLSCVASNPEAEFISPSEDEDGNDIPATCDGTDITKVADNFNIESPFLYNFNDPSVSYDEGTLAYDAQEIELFMPYVLASTQSDLNVMIETDLVDGSRNQDGSDMQYNIYSQSYDTVTQILTIHDKKFNLGTSTEKSGSSDSSRGGVSERIKFVYQIESQDQDRYVDFTGTWEQSETCDDNSVATANYLFDAAGLTLSGQECNNGTPVATTGSYSYAELAGIDFWWFNQEGRESEATLTELNSTVRFCDAGDYVMGDVCDEEDDYFVKWSYQPAGTDWDEGVLVRRKMDKDGNTKNVSTMQKVK